MAATELTLYQDLIVAYGGDLFEGCWLHDKALARAMLGWVKEHHARWYQDANESAVNAENLIREEVGTQAMALFLGQLSTQLTRVALAAICEEFEVREDIAPQLLSDLRSALMVTPQADHTGGTAELRQDALAHEDDEDFDLAIGVYERILDRHPADGQALLRRGFCHASLAEYDLAIANFTQAVRHEPELAEAYLHRGRMHAFARNETEAFVDIQLAVKLAPKLRKSLRPETPILRSIIDRL